MQIITTHKNTDFDALSSMIAANIIYPDAVPIIPRQVNPNVKSFLSLHKDLYEFSTVNDIDIDDVTSIIIVDTNSWGRLDQMKPIRDREDVEVILWDHHMAGGDIEADWKCHEDMGATVSLFVRKMREDNIALTPIQATVFLMGIYEDTGYLSFTTTRANDAESVAYLLRYSADLKFLPPFLQPVYSEQHKKILSKLLENVNRLKINDFVISINQIEISGRVNALATVVATYRELVNVDAAFCIFIDKKRDNCIIIARGANDDLDVGSVMHAMGGGGHTGAGSAVLKSVNPDTIESMITGLIEGTHQTSVQVGDLMSFPVQTIPADMSMEDVSSFLKENNCTGAPVVEDGELVGVISIRDFHKKIKKKAHYKSPVKAFMSRDVVSIEPDKSPLQAAKVMIKHDIGRMPVLDKKRSVIGIISRSDITTFFYDLLPQ